MKDKIVAWSWAFIMFIIITIMYYVGVKDGIEKGRLSVIARMNECGCDPVIQNLMCGDRSHDPH